MDAAVYAIRRKSTGLYLPDRRGKGYSNDEPTSKARPRLFWTRIAASAALKAWGRGRWVCKRTGGYGGGPLDLEYDEEVVVEPVSGRDLTDMEVVPFMLSECVDAVKSDKCTCWAGRSGAVRMTVKLLEQRAKCPIHGGRKYPVR